MKSTQDLLGMISALRLRLEQAHNLANDAGAAAASALGQKTEPPSALRTRLITGRQHQNFVEMSLQKLRSEDTANADSSDLPVALTSRALILLEQTREILQQLRSYSAEPLVQEEANPSAAFYQDTVLLADLVLRSLHSLPEKASVQLQRCSSLDVLLGVIQQRMRTISEIIENHRAEEELFGELARLLQELQQERLEDVNPIFSVAESIVQEAAEGKPLLFPSATHQKPLQLAAGHCLTTARVMARIARHDAEWRTSLLQPVVAALVHDVGMLTVPPGILNQTEELNEQQRGIIERHCRTGANLLARFASAHPWLMEAARSHHERLDGTGYPAGLIDVQIEPLVRLLAVCDVYTALCSGRPYRQTADSAEALSETMTMAQQGLLDRSSAGLLQHLSSYPVGAAVELNDGMCGFVVATQPTAGEEQNMNSAVVALLSDGEGKSLPYPRFVDLSHCDGRAVVRGLSAAESCKLFGSSYPQYV